METDCSRPKGSLGHPQPCHGRAARAPSCLWANTRTGFSGKPGKMLGGWSAGSQQCWWAASLHQVSPQYNEESPTIVRHSPPNSWVLWKLLLWSDTHCFRQWLLWFLKIWSLPQTLLAPSWRNLVFFLICLNSSWKPHTEFCCGLKLISDV